MRAPNIRQTLIGLRATHSAHRVASDISYPELRVRRPIVAWPIDRISGWRPARTIIVIIGKYDRFWVARSILVLIVIVASVLGAAMLLRHFFSK